MTAQGQKLDDCRGQTGNDVGQRALAWRRRCADELGVEVALDAAAPAADEREIESAANGGAGERNEARDPFFRGFGADANCKAFNNERREFFDELLFRKVLAEIDSRGSSSGEPEFALLFVIAGIETVKQTEPLDEAKCDEGENARVRDDGDHAAEAETGAFEKSEAPGIANQYFSDGIQPVDGHVAKVAEVSDVDAVLMRKITAEGFAIDLDRTEAASETEAKKAREWSS